MQDDGAEVDEHPATGTRSLDTLRQEVVLFLRPPTDVFGKRAHVPWIVPRREHDDVRVVDDGLHREDRYLGPLPFENSKRNVIGELSHRH